jgi:RNA polymerase sigma factor (sigma-70 family)
MISDEEWIRLWRGCLAGDPVLTAAFCRHAEVLIRGYLRRWHDNPDEIADLAQGFLFHLFKEERHRLQSFRPELNTSLPGYLKVPAWRFYIDWLRKNRKKDRDRNVPVEHVPLEQVIDCLTSPPEAERLVANRELREMIGKLPDREREAILWRLEGLRDAEIANLMGITAGAVGAYLSRARDRLRKWLVGDDEDSTPAGPR